MRKSFALICFLLLLSSSASPPASSTNQKALALTHVTVIDTTGGPVQPDVTVVIRHDRIMDMGKSGKVRVPVGSHMVDATGKFLIPGLWDMDVLWYEPNYLPVLRKNSMDDIDPSFECSAFAVCTLVFHSSGPRREVASSSTQSSSV